MLHLPSMLIYGFLSFSMAFLNKALFEISDFRNSLFVIFIQLVFVILSFQILGYIHLMPIPIMTKNDAYTFLIPSIFYSLSTILSLQALMKLNVAIYVVIKVCKYFIREKENKFFIILALYTGIDICSIIACLKETKIRFKNWSMCICNYSRGNYNING